MSGDSFNKGLGTGLCVGERYAFVDLLRMLLLRMTLSVTFVSLTGHSNITRLGHAHAGLVAGVIMSSLGSWFWQVQDSSQRHCLAHCQYGARSDLTLSGGWRHLVAQTLFALATCQQQNCFTCRYRCTCTSGSLRVRPAHRCRMASSPPRTMRCGPGQQRAEHIT